MIIILQKQQQKNKVGYKCYTLKQIDSIFYFFFANETK